MNPLEILAYAGAAVALAAALGGIFVACLLVVCHLIDLAAPAVEGWISELMCRARGTKP